MKDYEGEEEDEDYTDYDDADEELSDSWKRSSHSLDKRSRQHPATKHLTSRVQLSPKATARW